MWTVRTKTGKYKFVERYYDADHKPKYVSITLAQNRRQDRRYASDALRARINALTASGVQSHTPDLKTLADAYYRSQERELKEQTAIANDLKMRRILKLLGEDTKVSDLTAPYVRNQLWAERPSTYNERLKHFKAMMRWAYREELVGDIAFIDKLPRRKDAPTRIKTQDKFLEKEELSKLINGMTEPHWRLLTEFLALSGMRIGEAIALMKTDVTDRIAVSKTYSVTLRRITDSAKTDMSVREVYVQSELKDCIERIHDFCKGFPSPYFLGWEDSFISYDAYAKYFRENTERILGRRLTPHSLRHTHVALLAEAGVPLDAISRRLGHADSKITREVYYHVTKKKEEAENDFLDTVKLLI